MEIRVTTVVWTDVSQIASQAAKRLEEILQSHIGNMAYDGSIVSVLFVIISVSDEIDGNNDFLKARTKSGFLDKDLSGHKGRFLSYGFEVHSSIFTYDSDALMAEISRALLKRVNEVNIKIPKGFNIAKFKADISECLVNVLTAT